MPENIMAIKHKIKLRTIFPFLGLIVVLVLFGILTKGTIFSDLGLIAVLNDAIYVLLGTIGYLFLLLQGEIDFSIGANMGVSCTIACIAANTIGPVYAAPAAILTGSTIGLVNGFLVSKGILRSFETTLATMFILQGLVLVLLNGNVLGAPLSMHRWFTDPLKLSILAIVLFVSFMLFNYTKLGKVGKVVGSGQEAVGQTGVSKYIYRLLPFIIMGMIAGILGFISLIRTGSATNNTGSGLLFNVLNAALLGGQPLSGGPTVKFRSTIVGSLTIAFMVVGMTILRIGSANQQIVKGVVFLIAAAVSFDRRNRKVIK